MKFYLPFIALLFTSLLSSAQSAVVSSGGDATGSGGSAAYSIGQVSIDYSTGTGGSIQEGVQQTFEVSQVNVHESLNHVQLSFFPNPAKDELNITMTEFENGLTATIRDSKGMTVLEFGHRNIAFILCRIRKKGKLHMIQGFVHVNLRN
ncbi:MAG: hypothetical protein ACKOZM_02995, partial [Flavobacteriales bacterium]